MLINNWDIARAGARQWDIEFAGHAIANGSSWIENSSSPVLLRNTIGFKTIGVTLMLNGEGREAILGQRSEILSRLLAPCSLTLDGYSNKFFGIMKKFDPPDERVMNRWHTMKFEFQGYEYGEEITIDLNGRTEVEIINPGNLITPAVIEITSGGVVEGLTIKGISRNLTIQNGPLDEERNTSVANTYMMTDDGILLFTEPETKGLYISDIDWVNDLPVTIKTISAGENIIINGENGLITENGMIPDVEFWELPTLLPGSNVIAVNDPRPEIKIRYCPRYM